MSDLTLRFRHHTPNHIRSIEVQALDALLRIEEQLMNLNARLPIQAEPAVFVSVPDRPENRHLNERPPEVEEKPAGRRNRK